MRNESLTPDELAELYSLLTMTPALTFCYQKLQKVVYYSLKLASSTLSYGADMFLKPMFFASVQITENILEMCLIQPTYLKSAYALACKSANVCYNAIRIFCEAVYDILRHIVLLAREYDAKWLYASAKGQALVSAKAWVMKNIRLFCIRLPFNFFSNSLFISDLIF